MIILDKVQTAEISEFGRHLLNNHRDTHKSFEEVARASVEAIYTTFCQENGQSAFGLVRLYRLCNRTALSPEVQSFVAAQPGDQWMALMATIGDEPAWCDRRQSQGHQAISAGANQSPMLRAALNQLGIQPDPSITQADRLQFQEASFMTSYFHVENALGSPHIPAQDGFVKPYGIQSVIGLGSIFISQSLYLALCFSKVFVSKSDARKFSELSSFLSTLMAVYDGRAVLWSS